MKKLFILLLASAFVFAACSNGNSKPDEPVPEPRTEVTGKLGKYGSPYKVGDILFNDGSATPYTAQLTLTDEQKAAAIALIFYKDTGLNNGDDTTTSRTLGVGLKHSSGLAWCKNEANAHSRDITTIQESDKNGSDNLEQIAAFLTSNSSINDTGIASNYPAFYFAKNYKDLKIGSEAVSRISAGSEYSSGWYLPSIAELDQIYVNGKGTNKVFDIDSASNLCDGDQFGSSYYWSSSQHASNTSNTSACSLSFGSGGQTSHYKQNTSNYVCAIREFN